LTSGCSEQGKQPAAKAFKLAERDKHMSEQKQSFMQQLDQWTDDNVIGTLNSSDPIEGDWNESVEQVKKAIREKVLESYRNGKAAGGDAKSRPGSFRPRRQSSN
jgi:chloramphenicol 3-O-phosphotransferase